MAKKAAKPQKKATNRPKKKSENIVTTLAAVARHFKVSYDAVQRQWRGAGMPVEEDGSFDLEKIEEWQSRRNTRAKHALNNPEAYAASAARRQRDEYEAKIKEQELLLKTHRNQVLLGSYVSREDVDRFFAAFFTMLRDESERVHLELKATLPKEYRDEIAETIRLRHELMLTTLYRQRVKLKELAQAEITR